MSVSFQAGSGVHKYPFDALKSSCDLCAPVLLGSSHLKESFSSIDSNGFVHVPKEVTESVQAVFDEGDLSLASKVREGFDSAAEQGTWSRQPVSVAYSNFILPGIVQDLMANKKGGVCATGKITNMEVFFRLFIAIHVPISMVGDYKIKGDQFIQFFHPGFARQIVLSTKVKLDLDVLMDVVGIKSRSVKGFNCLSGDGRSLWAQVNQDKKIFYSFLFEYDIELNQYIVYHLTSAHYLPSLQELSNRVFSIEKVLELLNKMIREKAAIEPEMLRDLFVCLDERGERVASLEVLFNICIHEMRNEFSSLEMLLPQGYVYTVDDDIEMPYEKMLVWLKILACKYLQGRGFTFDNLKVLGFNKSADKETVLLFEEVFCSQGVVCMDKEDAFAAEIPGTVWVLHVHDCSIEKKPVMDAPTLDEVVELVSDVSVHLKGDHAPDFYYRQVIG